VTPCLGGEDEGHTFTGSGGSWRQRRDHRSCPGRRQPGDRGRPERGRETHSWKKGVFQSYVSPVLTSWRMKNREWLERLPSYYSPVLTGMISERSERAGVFQSYYSPALTVFIRICCRVFHINCSPVSRWWGAYPPGRCQGLYKTPPDCSQPGGVDDDLTAPPLPAHAVCYDEVLPPALPYRIVEFLSTQPAGGRCPGELGYCGPPSSL